MQISFTANEISAILVPQSAQGATTETIGGIGALSNAIPGDLSFLGNTKYKSAVFTTKASIVLLPIGFCGQPQPNQLFIFVENPSASLGLICARIAQTLWPKPVPGIHPSAWVHPSAKVESSATIGPLCVVEAGVRIGERVHLQAQVFIGQNAVIGEDCWLMPGVIVSAESELKSRVQIQSGAVIGSDGFGYEFHAGHHVKVPQIGNVLLEDDVEIGANTTIDRARFSRTVIGAGTKIDNLVQIGHNVIVGRHCMICAQAGISGSSVIGDYVIIGGQAGVAGHLTVGRASRIDGQAGVNTDLISDSFVKGSPCMPYYLEQRVNVLRRRLPDLFRRVDVIEQQMTNVK